MIFTLQKVQVLKVEKVDAVPSELTFKGQGSRWRRTHLSLVLQCEQRKQELW